MKVYCAIFFCFILLLSGCTGNDQSTAPVEDEIVTSPPAPEIDSLEMDQTVSNIPSLWSVEVQPDNSEKLKQPDTIDSQLSPNELMKALNESYPEIQLSFDKISNDTAYISIPQSGYLTDQTGSTGAYNYLAAAVYNITELKDVRYVTFNFKEGDHAAPGTYKRDDFKRLR